MGEEILEFLDEVAHWGRTDGLSGMTPEEAKGELLALFRSVVPKPMKEEYVNLERADDPSYTEGIEWNNCREEILKKIV